MPAKFAQRRTCSCEGCRTMTRLRPKSATLALNPRASAASALLSRMLPAVRSPCRMSMLCRYAMPDAISRAVLLIATRFACATGHDGQSLFTSGSQCRSARVGPRQRVFGPQHELDRLVRMHIRQYDGCQVQ